MRWKFEVTVIMPKSERRFEVYAKDEREALDRISHCYHPYDLQRAQVLFMRGELAPKGAW